MPKTKCKNCEKEVWSVDSNGFCAKCAKEPKALKKLMKRVCDPPAKRFHVPGDSNWENRGLYKEEVEQPKIYVVHWSDNTTNWCADPAFLRKAMNACKEMVAAAAKGQDKKLKQKWFGNALSDEQAKSIDTEIGSLDEYLQNKLASVKFACTGGGGIAAIDPTKFNKSSTVVTVLLDRGFYWNRFSDGEIMCSIVHEFTHIILKTKDIRLNSVDQYGAENCIKLAEAQPKSALENADNWAYYICEFRGNVTATETIDWQYLDLDSFKKRGPLAQGKGPP